MSEILAKFDQIWKDSPIFRQTDMIGVDLTKVAKLDNVRHDLGKIGKHFSGFGNI